MRIGKVQGADLGHAQQALNLRQTRLTLQRRAEVGNRVGRLALKEQQNPQVGLRIHIFRIDGHSGLKLRDCQGRLLLIEVAVCLLDVRRKLLLLVFCPLREIQRNARQ